MLRIETEPKVKMTMTVKKDKVKVRKSNPLKGAIIDVDCNTEITEVFGEKEGFEEPVDLFSEENAIIDDDNIEVWDDYKQDIVYETEKQKLLKQLELLEKENALRKNAKKYKSHIVDRLNADIKKNEDTIKKLENENLRLQEQLVELETIDDDKVIMDYLAISFADEVNSFINKDTPKPVKAKKIKTPIIDDGKEKPERKSALLRKYQWENLPD